MTVEIVHGVTAVMPLLAILTPLTTAWAGKREGRLAERRGAIRRIVTTASQKK
ncbi:MAG TPA: hypothetical protein VHZ49_18430 [Methylomirabilota bacterium]|nr:hypothetical protein [Methylomirabilota bacterium]